MSNALILTAKSSEEKETGGISNLSSSIAKGRDQGKPLENVSSKFFVGTEVSLGYILSRLEKLTLEKKSRYYFAQFVGPKYFHPPWNVYLTSSTHSPIWKCHFSLLVFEVSISHIWHQAKTKPISFTTAPSVEGLLSESGGLAV